MLILPAIDLIGGQCVRLLKGEFDAVTRYGDPFAQLQSFERAGANWVHIVDLDGAKAGAPVQHELIGKLTTQGPLKVQCGGGVREATHVDALLRAGASRVVVGSVATRRPQEVNTWLDTFGVERICLAFDVRRSGDEWRVAAQGWAEDGGITLVDALDSFARDGLNVLVTDISRDGALSGPNAALMCELIAAYPSVRFQASGGVSSLADLSALRAAGAYAAITGRALYENCFRLEDALAL